MGIMYEKLIDAI